MSERIMTLSVSFGNEAAVAARIGDFCGVLTGLHYVGDLLGAQLRHHLRRQFILEWQRRLERGDELTSFLALRGLAPATSLDVARDDEASESGAATIAPSTRRDRPPAVFPAEIVLPRWPLCRNR
jgi:hypothetical protein